MTPEQHDALIMAMIRKQYGPSSEASRRGFVNEPTARNYLRPGHDSFEQKVAGGVASGFHNLVELSGVPAAMRSGYTAYNEPTGGNIGQAAFDAAVSMPGLSLLGKAPAAAARLGEAVLPATAGGRATMAGGLLGGGLVANSAAAGEPDNPFAALDAQIGSVRKAMQEHEGAKAAAEAAAAKQWEKQSLGPKGRADAKARLDAEWSTRAKPMTDELSGLTRSRTEMLSKIEADKATTAAAEADKSRRANTRLADLYPSETMAGQAAAVGSGLLLSGLTKGRNVARYNSAVGTASDKATAASAAGLAANGRGNFTGALGSLEEAKAAQAQLDALLAKGPSSKGTMLPTIAGLDAAFLGPQLIDRYARSEPGSDLYNKSDPFKNMGETAMRMAGAAGAGALLSKLPVAAAGLMERTQPSGAQGMINALEGKANGRAMIDTDQMARTAINGAEARGQLAQVNGAVAQEMRAAAEAARRRGGNSGPGMDGELVPQAGVSPVQPTQIQRQQPPAGLLESPLPSPQPPAGTQIATTPNPGQQGLLSSYTPAINDYLGSEKGMDWARNASPAARGSLLDMYGSGRQMGESVTRNSPAEVIRAEELANAATAAGGTGSKGGAVSESTLKRQMSMLFDTLDHRGMDPTKMTREQLAEAFKSIDPRVFAVPAGIGIAAPHGMSLLDQ